jgi:hypothetical protein
MEMNYLRGPDTSKLSRCYNIIIARKFQAFTVDMEARRSPMAKKTLERWMDIFTTFDESEAAIITGMLEGAGVPCMVESSKISPFPVSVGRLGELKVLVHIEDVDKANMILDTARAEQEEEP